jgi:IclR family KDG regulon transcriptional repressor
MSSILDISWQNWSSVLSEPSVHNRHRSNSHVSPDQLSGSRSVRRALSILETLLRRDEALGVAEIARTLSIPRSTAYGIVNVLCDERYLDWFGDGRKVFLGPKLLELGTAYRSKIDLLKAGAPIVKTLRDETGETVQLSVLDQDMLLVLMKEEGSHPVRIISRVGSRVPVNWAAGGRLIVSDLDDAALRHLLRQTIRPSPTGKASLDVETLIRQIRKARKRGYSTELGETNEHAGCVAAPVIDASGHCVASISIAAPEQRLRRANRSKLTAKVRTAAEHLSTRLGAPQRRV